jgi:hypothetical protein
MLEGALVLLDVRNPFCTMEVDNVGRNVVVAADRSVLSTCVLRIRVLETRVLETADVDLVERVVAVVHDFSSLVLRMLGFTMLLDDGTGCFNTGAIDIDGDSNDRVVAITGLFVTVAGFVVTGAGVVDVNSWLVDTDVEAGFRIEALVELVLLSSSSSSPVSGPESSPVSSSSSSFSSSLFLNLVSSCRLLRARLRKVICLAFSKSKATILSIGSAVSRIQFLDQKVKLNANKEQKEILQSVD